MNYVPDTAKKTLMLVEDDAELAKLIKGFLSKYEFDISLVKDGYQAVERIIAEQPDIVILDIMLPGQTGMEVCRQVRPKYNGIILMQTALDDDIDQMMGLELGADDYVIKQVQPRLLLSRIRALLRRINHPSSAPFNSQVVTDGEHQTQEKPAPQGNSITLGPLVIDITNRGVILNQHSIELTTAEFELLYLLARAPGQVVSRNTIIQQIRGYDYDGLDRSIDRRISRLRKKLMDDPVQPQLIKTIRGQGYQLCPPSRQTD